ncbi:uncharacterized protein ColSpa_02941 [Colletotrichum spaethianum]|uniref:Uncharacterized protein n=1 Tax=Colletotrichum spaethianum TaxID=700344 RepID=A0AA37LB67_9PEZI|nr:uncharacterized protein ColSpa_02941 [Colletotrichum spaethianum]GKT42760.1 hypothetical protein ColSpa_02941 [Colletotrichum spaethianum]
MAYDTTTSPSERYCIQLPCCYKAMCYMGARLTEEVDGEQQKPRDRTMEILYDSEVSPQLTSIVTNLCCHDHFIVQSGNKQGKEITGDRLTGGEQRKCGDVTPRIPSKGVYRVLSQQPPYALISAPI